MEKLVDLLNTKYIAEHFSSDVLKIMNAYKEIDLAGAKLTPKIANIINNAILEGVIVRNSEDVDQDLILQENIRRSKLQYETKNLPKYTRDTNLVDYMRSLDEGTVYRVAGDRSLMFPVVAILQLYEPNVQLDLEENTEGFFRYVTETLYRRRLKDIVNSTDSYFLYTPYNYQQVTISEKDLNKEFYLAATGSIDWRKLTGMYQVLPSYFGVIKIQEDQKMLSLWEPVVDKAIRDIDRYFEAKRMTIKEFVEGE